MADEKKPIELTDDELDNAAGGAAKLLSEARRLSDKRVNSSKDLLSDEKKAILGAGAGAMSGAAGTKSGLADTKSGLAGIKSALDENK